ncbi:unnamed protein product [Symbiodinium necroappetens]|uniref:Uncharacterized protein n=1 Tax=Symbiodinium necroappetens TaxID=1628268 RepID=A0A812K854_9DINO|nr:unnamed protein product [Symbiodinium necroappetens]
MYVPYLVLCVHTHECLHLRRSSRLRRSQAKRQGCAVETGKARHRKLDRHLAKLKFGALASLATYQDTSSSFYWAVQRGLDKLRKDLDSKCFRQTCDLAG